MPASDSALNGVASAATDDLVTDYQYPDKTRKNIPLAGMPMKAKVKEQPKHQYRYDPHLPPVLRFDPTAKADEPVQPPSLLKAATQRPLTEEEAKQLADAFAAVIEQQRQPWLEWAGKREAKDAEVDPVALHIHERISAQAILKVAARQDVTRSLFADPEQEYREAVDFYKHDVAWTNRLILGDSLEVMASLARREDLAGKVQCIYMDPPYGIKYGSNFQSEVGRRDVKDKPEDLTREPEMVKAYRDTWNLGVHSYLAYLRDRLYAAKDLLTDSGSIFLQISDENLHRVRIVMDEVFTPDNFISQITYATTTGVTDALLSGTTDYVLWYCKNKASAKYRQLFFIKEVGGDGAGKYDQALSKSGLRGTLSTLKAHDIVGASIFRFDNLMSQSAGREKGEGAACWFPILIEGRQVLPNAKNRWKTNEDGMRRLQSAERIALTGNSASYIRFLNDFPAFTLSNLWADIGGIQSRADPKVYVVQTATEVIKRCLLMTTDPGDLVLDPTCGSGTTAYVAEQWGRRWISIDSSRVALAIARQRLMTARYDYYPLRHPDKGVSGGFVYKSVPHITLKSIAQNVALDPLFVKWEPVLANKLRLLNDALSEVTSELRRDLKMKLELKRKRKDRSDPVTDADVRRWMLPEPGVEWREWEVPFDTDSDWPETLHDALTSYRESWRAKMDEVNAAIAARAEQEELVDQPAVDKKKLRVSGPFTVEGVIPTEESLDLEESPIGGEPANELETFVTGEADKDAAFVAAESETATIEEASNAEAYLDKMLRLLRTDGVRFAENKVMQFTELRPLSGSTIHAEGTWGEGDEARRVAVSFGPQHGPITSMQVEECLRLSYRRGYDEIVFAGFSFDASAQVLIQENQEDKDATIQAHICHIRPDASPSMSGLLKDVKNATASQHNQIFTVSGLPRARATKEPDGQYVARMEGVDIYDPVGNVVIPTGAEKVAAWFLDSDYDGKTFCITQAFFPDTKAWEKLSKALTGVVDPDRFAAFAGTKSLPFPAGKYKRAAVKVIDPRGNEVMRVLPLEGVSYGG
jgi:adenine-specific DNA-methyltransferase